MQTYWDQFVEEYSERLAEVPLREMLEAFYRYCEAAKNPKESGHEKEQCDNIMYGE